MKFIFYGSLMLMLSISCTEKQKNTAPRDKTDNAKEEALYPYPQYIQKQIQYVDSMPLGIEMVVYENGIKKDSDFIDRTKFRQLAAAFMEPDPNEKKWRKQYEETSFQDLSLNTITFSIASKNSDLPLQKADILLNPDTRQVKFVVLKKQEKIKDHFETSNLIWVHNMNFQISTVIMDEQGKEKTKVVKVVWDRPISKM